MKIKSVSKSADSFHSRGRGYIGQLRGEARLRASLDWVWAAALGETSWVPVA
jgi:hypothetical protein